MNKLPPLPRVLKKREASVTPKIINWLEKNWSNSFACEVKIKGGRLEKHQKKALERITAGRFSYKMPDSGIGKMPFDSFGLIDADPLIAWYDPKTKEWGIEHYVTGEVTRVGRL